MKEVISRYLGHAPKDVFCYPDLAPSSVPLFDRASFCLFLARMPYNVGHALG